MAAVNLRGDPSSAASVANVWDVSFWTRSRSSALSSRAMILMVRMLSSRMNWQERDLALSQAANIVSTCCVELTFVYHTLSPLKPKDIGTDVDQGHFEDD